MAGQKISIQKLSEFLYMNNEKHLIKKNTTKLVINIVGYWHKDKHTDQGNRLQWNRNKPHIYGQLIFITGTKIIQ